MTNPMIYNQQLLGYLQAWRQLLEASDGDDTRDAMAAARMGMPPRRRRRSCRRCRPPARVPPDEPAGRLLAAVFGYLQAWRQYLEQG